MKTNPGRFFEDYRVGETIAHAVPRTLSGGERALYHALYPARHALHSSDDFARASGLAAAPLDDLLVFHTVFGKTVPDISLNAVANLGYGEGRWLAPVFPGDTLSATSEVIGLKQNSNGKSGVVWVRTTGRKGDGTPVLKYVRWVMVRKRGSGGDAQAPVIPDLAASVPFYGRQPAAEDVPQIEAPLLIHYAGLDERINAGWDAYKDALDAADKDYTVHIYPDVNHGFHNDTTPRYDEAAATLAWDRTLAFFDANLR